MSDFQPIGEFLDNLGCNIRLEDGDLVADAIAIVKVIGPDGSVRLGFAWSESMSWLDRLGLITAAYEAEKSTAFTVNDYDGDE